MQVLHSSDAAVPSDFADALMSPKPILSGPFLDLCDDSDSLPKQSSSSITSSSALALLPATSHSPSSSEESPPKIVNTRPIDESVGNARSSNRSEMISKPSEGFGSTTLGHNTALGFGASKGSTVSVLGPSGFGSLGSGIFGTGFGQVFNAGTKLNSFAAPIGDAKWGDQGGSKNLFGAPAQDDEEENSESEEYGLIDAENNDDSYEVVCKLQQQNGSGILLKFVTSC